MAEPIPPIVNIVGEKIALGPLRREVMATPDFQWGNDFAVTMMSGQRLIVPHDRQPHHATQPRWPCP